jgi:hypothetical protein
MISSPAESNSVLFCCKEVHVFVRSVIRSCYIRSDYSEFVRRHILHFCCTYGRSLIHDNHAVFYIHCVLIKTYSDFPFCFVLELIHSTILIAFTTQVCEAMNARLLKYSWMLIRKCIIYVFVCTGYNWDELAISGSKFHIKLRPQFKDEDCLFFVVKRNLVLNKSGVEIEL